MRCWLLLVAVALAPVASAQDAVYLMRGDQLPIASTANGYVQTITPGASGAVVVRVTTSLTPVGATGSYAEMRVPPPQGMPVGFALPATLDSEIRLEASAFEVATQVLDWVMTHVKIDNDEAGPQDASSVLGRRRGRCSGLANLTTALLLAAGFEARTVSGLLVEGDQGIPHRWVECKLPGAGWVPTDPTLGLWVISPRHVVFADAVRQVPKLEVLSPGDARLGRLPNRDGRPLRPNRGVELVCRLVGEGVVDGPVQALAVLHGPGSEIRRALLAPEGRFSGLLPGRWTLVVELEGVVLERRDLELNGGEVQSFTVRIPTRGGS
jgi:hypothetical protein